MLVSRMERIAAYLLHRPSGPDRSLKIRLLGSIILVSPSVWLRESEMENGRNCIISVRRTSNNNLPERLGVKGQPAGRILQLMLTPGSALLPWY